MPTCTNCNLEPETWTHCLFTCDRAHAIWNKLDTSFDILCQQRADWDGSLPVRHRFFKYGTREYLAALWFIWVDRNGWCFNGRSTEANAIFRRICSEGCLFRKLYNKQLRSNDPRRVRWHVFFFFQDLTMFWWHVFVQDLTMFCTWMVVHLATRLSWVLGVLFVRNRENELKVSGYIGVSDNLEAELHVIYQGILHLRVLSCVLVVTQTLWVLSVLSIY